MTGSGAGFDLHTHSSFSDGTELPGRVVGLAAAAGLAGLALTDHDTTKGWADATTAACAQGIALIPGMELSSRHQSATVHILAFLFDPHDSDLVDETDRIQRSRHERARRIVDRIAVDYSLEWADVLAQTTDEATIGRPHIADALVARGHTPDRNSAFRGILDPRWGYGEPHYAPSPLRAVELVRAAGGVPVLAHPAAPRSGPLDDEYVHKLVDGGLFGFELEHRENTARGKARLVRWANMYDLVLTGASDYHGSGKPNKLGENVTDPAVVNRIVAEASGSRPVNWPGTC